MILRRVQIMSHNRSTVPHSFWTSRAALVFLGFLGIAGFYLVTEHTAHLLGALPYLLLLACPLMHLFMHRGHGHGGSAADREQPR
jgi:hypothetical protein